MNKYITCDIQPNEWCTTECWGCSEAKVYRPFATFQTIEELREEEKRLFSFEWDTKPSNWERFYIIANNKIFCYNIINQFGKWRIVTE